MAILEGHRTKLEEIIGRLKRQERKTSSSPSQCVTPSQGGRACFSRSPALSCQPLPCDEWLWVCEKVPLAQKTSGGANLLAISALSICEEWAGQHPSLGVSMRRYW